MTSIDKAKQAALQALLSEEDYVLVVVDPCAAGVVLPQRFVDAEDPVGLHIGHRLAVPIPDLQLLDAGIVATLSFDRAPFACRLPWPAVVQYSAGEAHALFLGGDQPKKETPAARATLRLVD